MAPFSPNTDGHRRPHATSDVEMANWKTPPIFASCGDFSAVIFGIQALARALIVALTIYNKRKTPPLVHTQTLVSVLPEWHF